METLQFSNILQKKMNHELLALYAKKQKQNKTKQNKNKKRKQKIKTKNPHRCYDDIYFSARCPIVLDSKLRVSS